MKASAGRDTRATPWAKIEELLYPLGASDIQVREGGQNHRLRGAFRTTTEELYRNLSVCPEEVEWEGPLFTTTIEAYNTVQTFDLPLLRSLVSELPVGAVTWRLYVTRQEPLHSGDTFFAGKVFQLWLERHRPDDHVTLFVATTDPSRLKQVDREVREWLREINLRPGAEILLGPGTPAMREAISLHARPHLVTHGGLSCHHVQGNMEKPTCFERHYPLPYLELGPIKSALLAGRTADARLASQRLLGGGLPSALTALPALVAQLDERRNFRPQAALGVTEELPDDMRKDARRTLDPLRQAASEATYRSDLERVQGQGLKASLRARGYLRFEALEVLDWMLLSRDLPGYVALAKSLAEGLSVDLADRVLLSEEPGARSKLLHRLAGGGDWIRPVEVWRFAREANSSVAQAIDPALPQVWLRQNAGFFSKHFLGRPGSIGGLRNRSYLGHGGRGVSMDELKEAEARLPHEAPVPGRAQALLVELASCIHGPDPRQLRLGQLRDEILELLEVAQA